MQTPNGLAKSQTPFPAIPPRQPSRPPLHAHVHLLSYVKRSHHIVLADNRIGWNLFLALMQLVLHQPSQLLSQPLKIYCQAISFFLTRSEAGLSHYDSDTIGLKKTLGIQSFDFFGSARRPWRCINYSRFATWAPNPIQPNTQCHDPSLDHTLVIDALENSANGA